MKRAADFREIARNALRGKWPVAVLTGFLASLMGAVTFSSGGSSSGNGGDAIGGSIVNDVDTERLFTVLFIILAVLVIWLLVILVIGGAARLGYAVFNLKLVDAEDVRVSDLFSQFHRLGTGFCMNLLLTIYTLLWSLLFIIPGIIKSFSYAMTPYILAEHPELSANEAITRSRKAMGGNKVRLFCLGISFIGWRLLCIMPSVIAMAIVFTRLSIIGNISLLLWLFPCMIPYIIGALFLTPYQEAAVAAFYRDVAAPRQQLIPELTDDQVF